MPKSLPWSLVLVKPPEHAKQSPCESQSTHPVLRPLAPQQLLPRHMPLAHWLPEEHVLPSLSLLEQVTTRFTPHPPGLSVRRTVTSVAEPYVKAKRSPQAWPQELSPHVQVLKTEQLLQWAHVNTFVLYAGLVSEEMRGVEK